MDDQPASNPVEHHVDDAVIPASEPPLEVAPSTEPMPPVDPVSKLTTDFAAVQQELELAKQAESGHITTILSQDKELTELKAKLSDLRPVPTPILPDGSPLSEDALTQSNQIHALAAQEINRLRQLDQPGKHLTLEDLLDGPLHP